MIQPTPYQLDSFVDNVSFGDGLAIIIYNNGFVFTRAPKMEKKSKEV